MCGIVGVVGSREAVQQVLTGLKKLEYRGYDSAGIATLEAGKIAVRKAAGKIAALEEQMEQAPFTSPAAISIGHTRWATHGEPSQNNAHPHVCGAVAVVHNGIIENFQPLRKELKAAGYTFQSDTDTEVIPALINQHMREGASPLEAVRTATKKAEGAFALAILFEGEDNLLIGTRRGAPLVVGLGDDCTYLGSDPLALASFAESFIFLEEDDTAVLTPGKVEVYRPDGTLALRPQQKIDLGETLSGKAGYRHFMLKEIHEQPAIVSTLLEAYLHPTTGRPTLPALPCNLGSVPQINIVACGTAYYAGLVGKYFLEQLVGVPVNVDVASEFRYRQPPLLSGGVFIAISQSGETADTLAALNYAKAQGQHILAVTNTPTSSIARAADATIELMAGPEIAVASTKAFMAMLTALALLALEAAHTKSTTPPEELEALAQTLRELPSKLTQTLAMAPQLTSLAQDIMHASSMLYLGRGALYPLALEGALKIKEISYIHAEGYASGEMKHGPIALVDENLPVVNLATTVDELFDKTVSNMKEIEARRGRVILFTDAAALSRLDLDIANKAHIFTLPVTHSLTAPMIFAVPLQLLAYDVAIAKGTDVDQPRNLAKSVTVE